jgi:hypothetical protein
VSVVVSANDRGGVACDRRGCGCRYWPRQNPGDVGARGTDDRLRALAELRGWRCSAREDLCPAHAGPALAVLVEVGCHQ